MEKDAQISQSNIFLRLEKEKPLQISYFYGILANLGFTCANYISRSLSARHSSFQIVYMFSFQMFTYNYILLQFQNKSIALNEPIFNRFTLIRSLLTTVGCSCLFYAYPLITYAESAVILNASPVVTSILAVIFLKEVYTLKLFLKTVLSFIGLLLIAKPSILFGDKGDSKDYPHRTLAIILEIIVVFIMGIAMIILKKMMKKVDSGVAAGILGSVLAISFGFLQLFDKVVAFDWSEVILVIFNGMFEAGSQYLISRAYVSGQATNISLLIYARIVFAYSLEIIIDGVIPDNLSILGSVFIFCSFFVHIFASD